MVDHMLLVHMAMGEAFKVAGPCEFFEQMTSQENVPLGPRLRLYDRRGNLVPALSDQEAFESLKVQLGTLVNFVQSRSFTNPTAKDARLQLFMQTYYSFRLAKSVFQAKVQLPVFQREADVLFSVYQDLLNQPLTFDYFVELLAFSFLLLSMEGFGASKEGVQDNVQAALAMLLSSVEPEFITRACQLLLPGPQLAALFLQSLAHDFVTLELIAKQDTNAAPAVRMMADLVKSKYGKIFTLDFADDLVATYNSHDYFHCAELLWDNATDADDKVLVSFGRSFLIKMVKLQWGIIRESRVLAVDASAHTLLIDDSVGNYMDYTTVMFTRLFALTEAMDRLFFNNSLSGPILAMSADTVAFIYQDMNEYLERLATALMDTYAVAWQDSSDTAVDLKTRVAAIKSAKLTLLLGAYNLAMIKKILIGPLNRINAASHSAIVDRFVSSCDYRFLLTQPKPPVFFSDAISRTERSLYESFSFLMALSDDIKRFLNGSYQVEELDKPNTTAIVFSCVATFFIAIIAFAVTSSNLSGLEYD